MDAGGARGTGASNPPINKPRIFCSGRVKARGLRGRSWGGIYPHTDPPYTHSYLRQNFETGSKSGRWRGPALHSMSPLARVYHRCFCHLRFPVLLVTCVYFVRLWLWPFPAMGLEDELVVEIKVAMRHIENNAKQIRIVLRFVTPNRYVDTLASNLLQSSCSSMRGIFPDSLSSCVASPMQQRCRRCPPRKPELLNAPVFLAQDPSPWMVMFCRWHIPACAALYVRLLLKFITSLRSPPLIMYDTAC